MFPDNLGSHLSIDETSLSNGELYTIVTNKSAKGKKGALVAIVKGTKSKTVSTVLNRIPFTERMKVKEVTLDMANSMDWIVRQSFPNARRTTDRFHTQKLVSEALQEMRIKLRWKAIERENKGEPVESYTNGDSEKQLLARSRYLLFKPSSKWTDNQKERAVILFQNFPELKEGYNLSMMFRSVYEHTNTREQGKKYLDRWYRKVKEKNFKSFNITAGSIQRHEDTILNYFPTRNTNASAESFNAKIKGFRSLVRGVTDKKFFLFRIAMIYG